MNDRRFVWRLSNDVLVAHGLPTFSEEEFIKRFREPYWRFFREAGLPAQAAIDAPLKLYRERLPTWEPEIFAEVPAALMLLQSLGVRLGLVTHTPAVGVRKVFAKFAVEQFFASVITPDECKEQKPSPKPLLLALKTLNLPAQECVYVGDMVEDTQAARAAGMLSAAMWRPDGSYNHISLLQSCGADFVVQSLHDLAPLVSISSRVAVPLVA